MCRVDDAGVVPDGLAALDVQAAVARQKQPDSSRSDRLERAGLDDGLAGVAEAAGEGHGAGGGLGQADVAGQIGADRAALDGEAAGAGQRAAGAGDAAALERHVPTVPL